MVGFTSYYFISNMLSQNDDKDAIAIAPDLHKVIFENDTFRVLDVIVPPGAKAEMHWHPENVSYIATAGILRFTKPDGTTRDIDLVIGQVTAPGEGSHIVENIGITEVRAIQVELKK